MKIHNLIKDNLNGTNAQAMDSSSTPFTQETADAFENRYITLIDSLLKKAVLLKASDIHIEPYDKKRSRIRIRIDGLLHTTRQINAGDHNSLCTRLKIMSGLDIAEKRLPQDGSFQQNIDGRIIDFRAATIPTAFGEKIVLRILDSKNYLRPLSSLGFFPHDEKQVTTMIKRPQGLILASGPTGCGKSTTLYSLLNLRNTEAMNIMTVEDPIEINIPGMNQTQVNEKQGLTFGAGLRAILRQDPNIIMLGEIRDEETAMAAFRAALTGHLVLSTLHTNDVISTLDRLIDMKVPVYLIASLLEGILSQRLVRLLCPKCKKPHLSSPRETAALKLKEPSLLYEPVGCPACHQSGYIGRRGIFEVLKLTDPLRDIIRPDNRQEIHHLWGQHFTPFSAGIRTLIMKGVTSYNEGIRIISL